MRALTRNSFILNYTAHDGHLPLNDFTLDLKVELEGMKMELLLSESPPPQHDFSAAR